MRLTLENCSVLSVSSLQKTIRKIVDRDYPDSTYTEIFGHTQEELHKFRINDQVFDYTAIENKLGGHRWFFLCPECGNRVSKLFLPPESSNLQKRYLCKKCHNLKNQSAVFSQNKLYRNVTRPLKRMSEIEKKLEKGYLKADRVQELLDEYENLEKQLKSAPEYRLYLFKKKREMSS